MYSEIDLLILDYIDGNLTKEQEAKLSKWVEESEQNTEYFSQSIAYLELTYTAIKPDKFSSAKGWKKLSNSLHHRQRIIRITQEIVKIAAVFLLAFLMGYYFFQLNQTTIISQNDTDYIVTEVPYGSKSVVTLPDGSRVWINAGSSVSYPMNFNEHQRTVKLDGEAFFDIVTNKKKPFLVETWGVQVKATGTQFNVRAYCDEEFIETILVEGEVAVNRAIMPHKEDLILKPNQKLTIYKDEEALTMKDYTVVDKKDYLSNIHKPIGIKEVELTSNIRTDIYTSWKDKEWIIYKEKFGTLAQKLERRYDVKINIQDEAVYDLAYSGTLKDENLKEVLDVLSITSPIKYVFDNKNVTIWYNPEFYENN